MTILGTNIKVVPATIRLSLAIQDFKAIRPYEMQVNPRPICRNASKALNGVSERLSISGFAIMPKGMI